MRTLIPLVAVAAIVVALPLPAAHADGRRDAKKHLKEGDAAFQKGDYEGALAAYQKAYEAFPNPLLYYPMAQAEEKLGRDLEALQHYEMLLSEAEGEGLTDGLRNDVQTRITEIERRIAVVEFDIRPKGSSISVDDVELGMAPLDKAVRLLPGPHKYVFTAHGYKPSEMEVTLDAGDRPIVEVTLLPEGSTTKPKKKGNEGQEGAGGSGGSGGGDQGDSGPGMGMVWFGTALTIGLAGGATVTGVLAMGEHAVFADAMRPLDEREAARSSGEGYALATDMMIVGAAAAGAFTLWYYYAKVKPARAKAAKKSPARKQPNKFSPPDEEDDDEAMLIVPFAGPNAGGIGVVGTF